VTRRTTPLVAIAVAAATVLIFVTAGRSPGGKSSHRAGGAEASRSDVRVARTALGRILVNAQGHTLYLFRDDHDGKSACTATCTRVWPPAIVTHAPRAGVGIEAAKLTTTRRANNTRQLVYNGHPLYAMVADTRPGQTQGQGFLGTWFVVSPAGHQIGHAERSAGY
jgi:predicted lipoprotein with Yx(FWY)xxD motif